MSLQELAWALNTAPTDGPLERLVLVCLANGSAADGVVSVPDWQGIAACAGVPLESVRHAVARMGRRGMVLEEDGTVVLGVPWAPAPLGVVEERKARIHPEDRDFILQRDGHACLRCGNVRDLTMDHVQPESLGGASDRSNYQTLCRPCNSWKGTRIGAEFDYRLEGTL